MNIRPDRIRQKVRIAPVKNRDELTALVIATADLTIERDVTAARRDQALSEIQDGFNVQIETLDKEIAENVKRMRAWALAHRGNEFGERQSITVAGHDLEFRKGSGKVAYLPGVKAGDALDALLASEDATIDRFAKVSVALDKNAILRAYRDSSEARSFLQAIGITVVVEEDFRFRPNRPEAEAMSGGKESSAA
ncbi:phage host-nuclease inhibitor protein Gam [Haloferula luteola]|uniref:Phage host-nuclease inhibitor protein Gam n=1 Tax=Haloferula luteola TaxID=595692 RepID=A0A840V629_9BACT|nr:host-nuclease inhibitor Gam family protein [Haloferula luteola]MBB5351084.1 phage host-nuclease inhibitor protein Gam [Haloferula luteola]